MLSCIVLLIYVYIYAHMACCDKCACMKCFTSNIASMLLKNYFHMGCWHAKIQYFSVMICLRHDYFSTMKPKMNSEGNFQASLRLICKVFSRLSYLYCTPPPPPPFLRRASTVLIYFMGRRLFSLLCHVVGIPVALKEINYVHVSICGLHMRDLL